MKTMIVAAALVAAPGLAAAQTNTASVNVDVTTTIVQPLSITKATNLAFGRIVKPASGSGTVAIATGSDAVNAGSGAVALPGIATTRAKFTITGEGAQAVSISMPASVQLHNGSDAITVTLAADQSATATLSGALGSQGSLALYVGGSFALPSTAPTGAYAGQFTVTTAYN